MSADREELKRKAMRAIDAASEAELERGRRDKEYAENWLQDAIGFIAGLITIIGALFSCLVTKVVYEHFGYKDDCQKLNLLRNFRDEHLLNSRNDRKIESVYAYYALAPHIIRWMSEYGDKKSRS